MSTTPRNFSFRKMNRDIVNQILDNMVEIKPLQGSDFLNAKEILTRTGIFRKDRGELIQSAVILKKGARQFIASVMELKVLDGVVPYVDDRDIARRNAIAQKLVGWNMVTVLDESKIKEPSMSHVDTVPYKLVKSGDVTLVQTFRPFTAKE